MNTRRIAAALRELAEAFEDDEDPPRAEPGPAPKRYPPRSTGLQIDDVTRQRARRLLRNA
jgi:hypothetical protein